jgi:surfeit locus 1 family protein
MATESARGSTGRRLVWLVPTLLLSALFVRLGFWQLDRLEQKRDLNAAIVRAERESPRPIEHVREPYRRVRATGTYHTDDEVVVYGRSLNGRPGNHLLTPLMLEDGRAVLVDRGWIPSGNDEPPVPAAAPPSGQVVATGILFPAEADTGGAGITGTGKVAVVTKIDVSGIATRLPYGVVPGVYLRMQAQRPPDAGPLPRTLPPPEITEGPHLSYAIQWFSFAAGALAAYIYLNFFYRRRPRPEDRGRESARNAELRGASSDGPRSPA